MPDEKDKKPAIPPLGGGKLPPLPIAGILGAAGFPSAPSTGAGPALPPFGGVPALPSPGGLPGLPPPGGLSLPGGPALPSMPSMPGPMRPPMQFGPMPGGMALSPQAPAPPDKTKELEGKVLELEKRLQDEREKVLLSNIRNQEEAAYASKVESAIKEVQEKLRRDRRDAEIQETRLKLENQVRELEERLAHERETWVTTLQGQMRARETQDKEIETHFAMRIQEMERRWLEEKAHWQKMTLAKDEEIRNYKALAEKLKGVESEWQKALGEKKLAEDRLTGTVQDLTSAQARLKTVEEHEKDYFQIKAELMTARQENRMLQERMERELQMVRLTAQEREDRLNAEAERLQKDLQTVTERVRNEAEMDIKKYKVEANMAQAALQRLKAVASALERQASPLRAQAEDAQKLKAELDRANERAKAEFSVLQRRWQEREKEIRQEVEKEMAGRIPETGEWRKRMEEQFAERERELRRTMEAEKTRAVMAAHSEAQELSIRAQEEMRTRFEREVESMRERMETEVKEREGRMRDDLGHENAEIQSLQETLRAREAEIKAMQATLQEVRGRGDSIDKVRFQYEQEKETIDRNRQALAHAMEQLKEEIGKLKAQLAAVEQSKQTIQSEKENLEKLASQARDEVDRLRKEGQSGAAQSTAQQEAQRRLQEENASLKRTVEDMKEEIHSVSESWQRQLEQFREKDEEKVRLLEAELAQARTPKGIIQKLFGKPDQRFQ